MGIWNFSPCWSKLDQALLGLCCLPLNQLWVKHCVYGGVCFVFWVFLTLWVELDDLFFFQPFNQTNYVISDDSTNSRDQGTHIPNWKN